MNVHSMYIFNVYNYDEIKSHNILNTYIHICLNYLKVYKILYVILNINMREILKDLHMYIHMYEIRDTVSLYVQMILYII